MTRLFSKIRRTLLAGMLVLLPPLITVFLILLVLGWIEKLFNPLLRATAKALVGHRIIIEDEMVITLIGVLLSLVIVYVTGLLATNYFGRRLLRVFDRIVLQIPLVKGIYGSAKQLLEAFNRPHEVEDQQVVLIEFPRKGVWVIGFCTGETHSGLADPVSTRLCNVFLPTTPNPTSGYLLLVPKADVIFLDISIEDAVKFVVSGGLVQPEIAKAAAGKKTDLTKD